MIDMIISIKGMKNKYSRVDVFYFLSNLVAMPKIEVNNNTLLN